ncbi:MAG: hypothetical protein UX51_C0015G0011 [Candidatus Azambacteria bacterium GW2011_GWF2_46_32]|uniref:Uncharacterized protein n=1 Tax=Candidatus Azambacteria bacterium GW2011_GWF2_46_32 TaxID=1618628 RepID=A0A0G1PY71_9BACT|nr:MAG: hypothetical protein UX51_C0015G0011 [Candidatus Azambacteria bacterium GW2011_GWF2_46_32]
MREKKFILFSIFALLAIFGMAGFVNAVGYEIPFPSAVEKAAAGEGIAGYVNRLYIYALGLVGLTAIHHFGRQPFASRRRQKKNQQRLNRFGDTPHLLPYSLHNQS